MTTIPPIFLDGPNCPPENVQCDTDKKHCGDVPGECVWKLDSEHNLKTPEFAKIERNFINLNDRKSLQK